MLVLVSVFQLLYLAHALWPIPREYDHGNSTLFISKDVQVNCYGHSMLTSSPNLKPDDYQQKFAPSAPVLEHAIDRMRDTIFTQNFIPWKFHPRRSSFEPSYDTSTHTITSINLHLPPSDPLTASKWTSSDDESYRLVVGESGHVSITANAEIGIARALTTFTQLFYAHSQGGAYTNLAPVKISDAPKFSHRGLNMDVSRHFYPVPAILRTIDALAYNKMNRLHLHITDGQSWPLEVPSLPDLARLGAYQPSLTYTPEDVRNIQSYGEVNGVEVYLEIDMPGHTSSIWHAYPELIASFDKQPDWDVVSAEPPSGTLKLNSTAVYDFLAKLFADVLPRVSPYTSYWHTGGDEVKYEAYLADDTVRSSDPAVINPLLQKFIETAHVHVRKQGLTPIVWEEIPLDYNVTLGPDVIVQTWQSSDRLKNILALGNRVLVGNYAFWYLDCGHGQWLDFRQGQDSAANFPYLDYCDPLKNWRTVYSYDPLGGVPPEQHHLVLGGEVHIWSEQTDEVNLDRNVWPRAAAAAEVLWSGAKDEHGLNRSQLDASQRLAEMRERLVARGVMAEPVQMPWCTMSANGSKCVFPGD